jgi:hypothetical protein
MQRKYQPLQIYKWNSCSMLLKVFGIISYKIIGAPYALVVSQWCELLCQCRNPRLGFVTKARACKVVGQEGSPIITSHVLESVRECEKLNTCTPKWTPTLGVGVLVDFWIFRGRLKASKPIGLMSSLYHWKSLGI